MNESKELSMEELESFSGGTGTSKKCWFQSANANAANVEWQHGAWRLWCTQIICNSNCACHGTSNCAGKWHWISNEGLNSKIKPADYANHAGKNRLGMHQGFADQE